MEFVNIHGQPLTLQHQAKPPRAAAAKAAKEAGEQAMLACIKKAQQTAPDFAQKAERAILEHLRAVGRCSGEELTDIAKLKGAIPHDDRSFGAVFRSLSRRGVIRTVGYCARVRGHGTAGGRVWGIAG